MKNVRKLTGSADNRPLLRRIIVFGIVIFIFGVLHCAFFARLSPFGTTPDIMLGLLCAILMLDGKKSACVCSLAAGYFVDAQGAVAPALSPLFYLLAVCALIIPAEKMMPRFASFAALLLPAVLLTALETYISAFIAYSSLPPSAIFTRVLLPEMLSTYIFCLPLYFVIKLCMLPIDDRGHFPSHASQRKER